MEKQKQNNETTVDVSRIERAIREILLAVGEDPGREGLVKTPDRVARMYAELFGGLHEDPKRHVEHVFTENYDEIVLLKDIPFYSMCEHHLLPFMGQAHVGYLPRGKVVGVSKLARIVSAFARRPQMQERLTTQIADFLEETIEPAGIAVVVEAAHMCAAIRGVRKANSRMVTSTMRGEYKTNSDLRREFMQHISRPQTQELY